MSGLFQEGPWAEMDEAGDILLDREFLRPDEAGELFEAIRAHAKWQARKVFVGGQWRDQPRLVAWYGNRVYTYSKLRLEPVSYDDAPLIGDLARRVSAACGVDFNACLANYYRDGRDSIGRHSDNEPELGPRPTIASISLGATRTFRMMRNRDRARLDVPLSSGSLLLMRGASADRLRAQAQPAAGTRPRRRVCRAPGRRHHRPSLGACARTTGAAGDVRVLTQLHRRRGAPLEAQKSVHRGLCGKFARKNTIKRHIRAFLLQRSAGIVTARYRMARNPQSGLEP